MSPHREDSPPYGRLTNRFDEAHDRDTLEPIAIVGFSIGFPQDATTSEGLWEIMMNKRSTATPFPKERMNTDAIYHPDTNRRGQVSVRQSHFLKDDIASFDASFFATSTTDAASMDPQQRLLLEYTYKALESAGMPMDKVSGTKTSVYTGSFSTDWMHLTYKDGEQCGTTAALGTSPCFNANRISWFFNFKGNSANIDTACSSSLVALDLGCQGLRSGEEEMSIVAGSNVLLSPDNMHSLTNLNMLSPDGQCYSFDHRGNGYSRGEGFGVLILKRVSDAIRDHDTIRGIIRSTGCNQDGHTPSITLPNHLAQEKLIRDTYAKAGLSMAPTRFFEAHGTGTSVGDPNEAKALGTAFKSVRTDEDPLWVGALKSNIGHLEGASGVAGVIKALLVLEKAIIPPNTNFAKINPKIDTEFLRIRLPQEAMPWPSKGLRRASVNSFGNAGTNAHVVLDDVYHFLQERNLNAAHLTVRNPPPATALTSESTKIKVTTDEQIVSSSDHTYSQPRLLVFSANDERGTERLAQHYAHYYQQLGVSTGWKSSHLDDLAYTLSVRRSSLTWKSSAVIRCLQDLQSIDKMITPARKSVSTPNICFAFTGQGAQWSGMGRQLISYAVFQKSLRQSENYLLSLGSSWYLRQEMLREENCRISSPELSQPICTAIQIALVDLLGSFKIYPTAVVGHSSGEIAAAYCTGSISHESAIRLAYYRGTLAGSLSRSQKTKGAMMAVGLSEADVRPYLESVATRLGSRNLTIACVNSPKSATISGDDQHILVLKSLLEGDNIFARKLLVDVAYHSPHMQTIAGAYSSKIQNLERGSAPQQPIAMFSSVTGERVFESDTLCSDYWTANLLSPVRFQQAIDNLFAGSTRRVRKKLDLSHRNYFYINMIVEIGPHSALQAPIHDIITESQGTPDVSYTSVLLRNNAADMTLLDAVGQIRNLGYPVDIERVNDLSPKPGKYMALPNLPEYVFDHSKQYWDETRLSNRYRTSSQGKIDLLGKPVLDWNPLEPRWRNFLRVSEMPWIEDHVINGALIYPGSGMLVMAIEAACQISADEDDVVGFELKDVSFVRSLNIPRDTKGVETQFSMRLARDDSRPLSIWSQWRLFAHEQHAWHECCRGLVRARYAKIPNAISSTCCEEDDLVEKQQVRERLNRSCQSILDTQVYYDNLPKSGFGLGPAFQRLLSGVYNEQNEVSATVELYKWPEDHFPQPHVIHPTTLDCLFQVGLLGHMDGGRKGIPTMVPTFMRSLSVSKTGLSTPTASQVNECAWLRSTDSRVTEVGAFVLNSSNTAVTMSYEGLELTEIAEYKQEQETSDSLQAHQLSYHIEHSPDYSLLDDHAIERYCRQESGQASLASYISILAHKNSDLRILSIDLADDYLIDKTLQSLCVQTPSGGFDHPRYGSFCISATSEDELKHAKAKFGSYPSTQFVIYDANRNPLEQAFETECYDVIIGPSTLQQSPTALKHIRLMLKVKGTLLLHQKSDNAAEIEQATTDDNPPRSLQRIGFGEPRFNIADDSDEGVISSNLKVYGIMQTTIQTFNNKLHIVINKSSSLQKNTAQALDVCLTACGAKSISTISLEEASGIADQDSTTFILLLEIDEPLVYSMSSTTYRLLQHFFIHASNIMWINMAGGSDAGRPEYSLIHGLARALRSEYESLRFTVISFERKAVLSGQQTKNLVQILIRNHVLCEDDTEDVEYLEICGRLTVPRIVPTLQLTKDFASRSMAQCSKMSLIRDAPPLKLAPGSISLTDTLHFLRDGLFEDPIDEDEIEVQVKAFGMNFKDCLIAHGRITDSQIGQECSGIVTHAGSRAKFKTGDRVVLAGTDTVRTFTRSKSHAAFSIPDDMSFVTAATIPIQFGTAWMAVHRLARLQKGETILVHSAAGGTGQAIIQMAQILGAVIYCTVSTQEKKQLLMSEYHIPEAHIFYSRDTDFVKGIKRMTGGEGVDVVINSLVGEGLQASWECIASYGRFIEIGKKDILANSALPMWAFRKNASFHAFDGSLWLQERPAQAKAELEKVIDLFANGTIHPPLPLQVHDVKELQDVLKKMQDGVHLGKFVLEVTPESEVPTVLDTKPSFQLDSNATYVIAGGLGGIGRATARWMADRSARNLVLLSRSGPRTNEAFELLQELRAKDVRVETPCCDVTDLTRMQEVFKNVSDAMPPVKGCLQASIVAKDFLFKDLSYEDWRVAVDCKAVGSWNLHSTLPRDMDFFIMLSSASGLVGIKGQTNYDAGNTYEDALARWRVANGEKATTLDLGAMVDDGILAENPDLLNRVLAYGTLEPITRQKYFGILDYYCDPARPLLSPKECQTALGIGTGTGSGLESFNYSRQPMLLPLLRMDTKQTEISPDGNQTNSKQVFASSNSLDEASQIVSQAVIKKLAKSLSSMQDSSVDMNRPLQMHGVDSLLAIELRNWIVKEFSADIAVFETQGASTLGTLSMLVAGRSTIGHSKWSTMDE